MYNLKPVYQKTIVAVIIALNIVINFFLRVPTPTGFISLVEVGIFLMAWLLGPKAGGVTGALTGYLIDLIAGYPQWMFFSLIIHGTEGLMIGYLNSQKQQWFTKLVSILCGGIIMISGYFISGIFLQLWNHATLKTALTIATADLFGNALQVLSGAIVALLLLPILRRALSQQTNILK